LVDNFVSFEQKAKSIILNGHLCVTENKYRLPACLDDKSEIVTNNGSNYIYHFALENDNYYMNYGVYANGLLVETCSKRYITELSKLDIITSFEFTPEKLETDKRVTQDVPIISNEVSV
jgi:hypothetical protein